MHILNGGKKAIDDKILMLDPSVPEDEYEEDPEYADIFEPALWLILQNHDINLDPTIDYGKTRSEQLAKAQLGVLYHSFGNWNIAVNWQTLWAQSIPPHHFAVHFCAKYEGSKSRASTGEVLVGIMSPYFLLRTCWQCRLGDPIGPDGDWNEERYYKPLNHALIDQAVSDESLTPDEGAQLKTDLIDKAPKVVPAMPCPDCEMYDWFGDLHGGIIARPEDFISDAADELAKITGLDHLAKDMRLIHGAPGEKMRYAGTVV